MCTYIALMHQRCRRLEEADEEIETTDQRRSVGGDDDGQLLTGETGHMSTALRLGVLHRLIDAKDETGGLGGGGDGVLKERRNLTRCKGAEKREQTYLLDQSRLPDARFHIVGDRLALNVHSRPLLA